MQKRYHPKFNCKRNVENIVKEYLQLMTPEILKKASDSNVVSISECWVDID